jgi:hypothetical protein
MLEEAIEAAQELNISSDHEAIRSFVENVDIVCDGLRTGAPSLLLGISICHFILKLIMSTNFHNTYT